MRVIVQVVKRSSVEILEKNIKNEINNGLNVLVGFTEGDTKEIVEALAKKIVNLRIFMDENDKMNLSVIDTKGDILSISQFTLYGDVKKGNRPGFSNAMHPDEATKLYDYFNDCLKSHGVDVKVGEFGADMIVEIINVGPTTIILDSDEIVKKK
ncbi:D-tyrosyl-tRNA(Tyr) deacylase [Bacilli bacterium PM5-3]|nr:D-tyrosyl-tRNA(Tyr) deacylase [Bacilli bacterium PM5-3]MDH6604231.1 D-tyrosyl-tRNA(Tyr) deacylase [Bacilli bacterium PM5-9]